MTRPATNYQLSTQGAAAALGLSKSDVTGLCRVGLLDAKRHSSAWSISQNSVTAFQNLYPNVPIVDGYLMTGNHPTVIETVSALTQDGALVKSTIAARLLDEPCAEVLERDIDERRIEGYFIGGSYHLTYDTMNDLYGSQGWQEQYEEVLRMLRAISRGEITPPEDDGEALA